MSKSKHQRLYLFQTVDKIKKFFNEINIDISNEAKEIYPIYW